MAEKTKSLEERTTHGEIITVRGEGITYGMLLDGFQSISGIPDNFYSAEDPSDRVALWREYQAKQKTRGCGCGVCFLCDPLYTD